MFVHTVTNSGPYIALNRRETTQNLEEAISTITLNMAYSESYASIYAVLQTDLHPDDINDPLKAKMKSALPEFYAAVLVFSVKAKGYFESAGLSELPYV